MKLQGIAGAIGKAPDKLYGVISVNQDQAINGGKVLSPQIRTAGTAPALLPRPAPVIYAAQAPVVAG